MALFAVRCIDAPGAAPLRQQHLAAHLAHVEAQMERYRIAGPLAGTGSLLVIEADDTDSARVFIMADPYGQAGVWAEVIVEPFMAAAGTWVGGAAWKAPR
jgi:uncharacterized protein YciI